jgi:release factor glutamine methyltransferase
MTVLEVIQHSTEFLTRKGVQSARLHSELILAHVLNRQRMQLYLDFQEAVPEAELSRCRELVRRRGTREPLQHILGTVSFAGLQLHCGPQALVPRPETELLAEHAGTLLSRCANPGPRVLDFGTGTGCLAIALAVRHPTTHIWATDVSVAALELAQANATLHGVQSRIQFLAGQGLEVLPAALTFDLIVSNPPYIPSAEIETLEPEVKDHDPRTALDGGPDGLRFYRLLGHEAASRLADHGVLIVEFGDGQAQAIATLWTAENWIVEPALADYAGSERFLIARRSH